MSRNAHATAVALFIVLSSVARITAATGFVRLPVGSRLHRGAVSPAPCSPPADERRHSRAEDVAARRAGQLADALHLLPYGSTVHDAVGVKLYPHRLGVEIIEIELNLKYVLLTASLDLHFAKVKRGPFLVKSVLPIDQPPGDCAFVPLRA